MPIIFSAYWHRFLFGTEIRVTVVWASDFLKISRYNKRLWYSLLATINKGWKRRGDQFKAKSGVPIVIDLYFTSNNELLIMAKKSRGRTIWPLRKRLGDFGEKKITTVQERKKYNIELIVLCCTAQRIGIVLDHSRRVWIAHLHPFFLYG